MHNRPAPRVLGVLLSVLLVASPAAAGDAVVIRHARVFDGTSAVEDTDVLVRDGVIAQVGKNLEAADAKVIDATGKTLMPGLIDCHTHILAAGMLRQAAAFGVTTKLDLFMPIDLAKQLRSGDEAKNYARADFRTAGTLATAAGGHGTQFGMPIPTIAKPEEAAAFVDARIAEGSDHIKIIYDDGSSFGLAFKKLSRETMSALVAAAHAKGKIAVVHVTDKQSAVEAIEAGGDGLAHVFRDEPADDGLCKLAKEKKIFVTPTLAVMEGFTRDPSEPTTWADDPNLKKMMSRDDEAALRARFPRRADVKISGKTAVESVRKLHEAGVPILAGTDAPNPGTVHGMSLHRELELLVEAGLSPTAALTAATAAPADAYKLSDRGRIAAGKRADLVLVKGDPTQDIKATRAITHVWIAGRPFDLAGYRKTIEQRNEVMAKLNAPGPLMVSDFEGAVIASTFGLGWSISTDQIQRGKSTCETSLVEGGADGSKKSLQIKGSINPPLPWAWAGAMFSPGASLMSPIDLSAKKKISFWAKGDGKPARVMLFSRSGGPAPAFQVFTPGEQWEKNTFELKEFRDETGKDLTAVLFSGGVEHGPFEYQIDQVMFE